MPPNALLYISTHCPHCSAVMASLGELVKRGTLGRLEIVNLEVHGDDAQTLGVRSVPWLRLGLFELGGQRSPSELAVWARRANDQTNLADAFRDMLKDGDLAQVLRLVTQDPSRLVALLPILSDPSTAMNLRLGATAAFEKLAGSAALGALVPVLGSLSEHQDARVRADVCHCLGLAAVPAARPWLERRLNDASADVREIALEGLGR